MIPYNPSSFDTNKTILEQILELKNWLKDHPSYRIFVSNENGNTTMSDTYDLNEIVDDPSELGAGDAVLFKNGCVGSVSSVDFDAYTFDCNTPCVNVRGPQGPSGHNGVSVTGATIDGSGHLIVTLSNGNTIDAGMAKGADGTNGTNGTNGEDGAYVSAATVDGNGDLQITIYDPATSTTSTINAGHVVGPAGSGIQIVALTSNSGTLSADDLSKVTGTDDCIITYTNAGATLVFKRASIDSSYAYFTNVVVDGDTYYLSCEVNVTTGQYNLGMDELPIKASNVNSETATNGQVLTADGNGGASWQNASGGSLNKYKYTISSWSVTDYLNIKNIMLNSKGIIGGSVYIGANINLYSKQVTESDTTIVLSGVQIATNAGRLITIVIDTVQTTANYRLLYFDGSTWSISTGSVSSLTIYYINETQLH